MSLHSQNVSFYKDRPDAIIPCQMSEGAVGYDVSAVSIERIEGTRMLMLDTHIIAVPPSRAWLMLVARSSLFKHNLMPVNGFGVIDTDYRGHLKYVLAQIDPSKKLVIPKTPFRFGQIIIQYKENVGVVEGSEALRKTIRGSGGFGSTG